MGIIGRVSDNLDGFSPTWIRSLMPNSIFTLRCSLVSRIKDPVPARDIADVYTEIVRCRLEKYRQSRWVFTNVDKIFDAELYIYPTMLSCSRIKDPVPSRPGILPTCIPRPSVAGLRKTLEG